MIAVWSCFDNGRIRGMDQEKMGKLLKSLMLLFMISMLGACADQETVLQRVNVSMEEADAAKEDLGQDVLLESAENAVDGNAASAGVLALAGTDMPAETFYYGFSSLKTKEERQLYREILQSLVSLEEETELSVLDTGLLEQVFACVMADHPEIFYVNGYTSTVYRLGNDISRITFSGDYTLLQDEIESRCLVLEELLNKWLEGVPDGSDYEKVKYLYDYLITHTEYKLGCEDSQNICSVLLDGISVCQGYAKTFQLLCQRLHIPAYLVTGTTGGQGHAWNLVLVDGQWCYMDPTWGDASYRQEESGYPQTSYPAVNYDYFCVTTEQLSRTHQFKEGQTLPECESTQNQYYRREGLFLESADAERVQAIFERAAQAGAEVVTFQCADDAVYAQVYQMLIEEQKIFEYLPGEGTKVAYAESKDQHTLSFWLELS